MKIAIEAQRIFRKKKHGMDIVILEVIKNLQKLDHDNEYFILVKDDVDDRVIVETENFHIVKMPAVPYPVWEQILLPRKIKDIKPHLLHCTANTAPLKANAPLITTIHDIFYLKDPALLKKGTWYQRLGNLYRNRVVPRIALDCESIITVSEFEKEEIAEYFPQYRNKIRVVLNAYSSASFRVITDTGELDAYRRKKNLPENFVFFLGNPNPKKNLQNVLRAFYQLNQNRQKPVSLVITDLEKDFLDTTLKNLGIHEVSGYIHLTGYIPNNELVFLYNLADVFIYPSFYESFGIPILEAMASGTPAVVSDCTAIPEIAGDAGVYIDPNKPEEIADAIERLINDPGLSTRKREMGLKRVQSFSWQQTAMQTLKIYQEVYHHIYGSSTPGSK